MRVSIVAVGRVRDKHLAEAIREYEGRAAHYWNLDVAEVREEPARGLAPAMVKDREGERLLARVGAALLVACDPNGESLASDRFATWLRERRDAAQDVAFVIGGAFGLSTEVLARSSRQLLLAPFTLPHELARLVLAEQLYRAGTIVRGEPYHK
ncbi:MAG: hypothetical protein JWO05_2753 [Gemmatimonadetes bacterium]|nr:hypothetical protein [Gemmatimonadota bacterium]